MLSRVAENLYWMARYLERTEDMARLINATTLMLLDLPPGAHFGWDILLHVTGDAKLYAELYGTPEENRIMRFLIADERNPNSVMAAIHQARENCRTFRDLLPGEFWERLNTLFLYVRDQAVSGADSRHARYAFLNEVIARRHALVGLLISSMSQDNVYQFIKLGRNMERADMTTRIVDVTSAVILPQDQGLQKTAGSSLWIGVLKSLSAFEMYRRHISVQVRSNQVVDYLLKDSKFPRSMKYCLGEMEVALAYLPNAGSPAEAVRRARRRLDNLKLADLRPDLLHEYLDQAQKDLAVVHRTIQGIYFAREDTASENLFNDTQLQVAQA
ncbi:alpha-E domain-containing protein [Acidithiobacillus sp. M4-SHS-6]|uniref:alpha-E domain-containing protein n=1 Tax=Acidithiobacillus sp. M4-SHS-6 TaxID=3383024 RepID=UPI0039BEADD9